MTSDDLDRALTDGGDIVPSSGFVQAVMQAVHAEAAAPPPIPFPWKRVLAGLAAGVTLITAPMLWWLSGGSVAPAAGGNPIDGLISGWAARPEFFWAAGSLLATLLAVELPRRLLARS